MNLNTIKIILDGDDESAKYLNDNFKNLSIIMNKNLAKTLKEKEFIESCCFDNQYIEHQNAYQQQFEAQINNKYSRTFKGYSELIHDKQRHFAIKVIMYRAESKEDKFVKDIY
jgi:hypothetical protein